MAKHTAPQHIDECSVMVQEEPCMSLFAEICYLLFDFPVFLITFDWNLNPPQKKKKKKATCYELTCTLSSWSKNAN